MGTTTKIIIKKTLAHFPIQYSERMDALFHLPLLSRWIEKYKPHPYFEAREQLYEYVAERFIRDVPISFLEFGVYKGASISCWAELNTNVRSEFIGFDSFEGLPETWINLGGTFEQGSFSTGGAMPPITDGRMNFVKGWFQDTLPVFLNRFSANQQLVIHCDADLYSSTMFVLCKLDALINPGAIVIFDDFSSMLHDYRALDDYTRSFCRIYEVLGAAGRFYYENVAVRFTK